MKELLNSFHLNGHTLGFPLQGSNHLVQHNKQQHMDVLLNNFHLNGHTLGFPLQGSNHLVQHNKQHHKEERLRKNFKEEL